VGNGKGVGRRGGGELAWPGREIGGGQRWEMTPTGGSRLSVSVRGRGEAGRLSWATGERVGRGRHTGRLRRSGPEGLRAAVC
jgi:hypothetical protein